MCSGSTNMFEIIVGTYEQYLLGYKVQNIVNEYQVEKSFATHSHLASVRTVASSKRYVASAGADETVCLYDMRQRRECGKLMHHTDTINCVAFTPEGSHLFTCSRDGSIGAVRCGNWQMEKLWPTAHKGSPVNTIAIHPTGMLALSTGEDGVLRTWNLVKGRQAYATNLVPTLKSEAKSVTIIKWNPYGEKYLLAVNRNIYLYTVETASINSKLTFNSKVICAEFLTDDLLAIGFENGEIKFYDFESERTVTTKAHDMRVKCISHMNDLLVSASSSGEIKIWRYNKDGLNILKTVNSDVRITCLSLAEICKDFVAKKEVNLEEEEENEEKEEEVRNKSKLRLRQEVVIENEDKSEVTNQVASPKVKASKTKRNRSLDVEEIAKPKKKKKLSKPSETTPSKKRKQNSSASQTTYLAKKIKVTHTENNVQNSEKKILKSKEIVQKKKRNRSLDIEEIAKPKKKKKLQKPPETRPSKKEKQDDSALQTTSSTRKIRKSDKAGESSLPRKRHVIVYPPTDAPFKKIKTKVKGEVNVSRKKKKKSMK